MKLKKIKDASLDELRVRAAQRVAAFSERHGWSSLGKLPTDRQFEGLVSLNGRIEPKFFPSFKSPQETVDGFRSRWPNTAQRLVEKAARICEGKFDLLGLKNLSFGDPIVWQLEPTTNKRTPLVHWSKLDYLDADVAGDKKIIWELNRHQYFVTLGQAYWLTGDERYARVFATHLEAWMEENPPKLGINWASSLEVAFRSISWLWAFYFFKSSASLTPETLKRARKFLYISARHLESYLSTYFSPNTHLTGEALGLFFLGTMLPEFRDAKRWQTLGRQILIEQLPVHVKQDGVYFEQSSYYHRYTTDFYLHFLLLSRANNLEVPPEVEKYLVLLLDHLMYITRPDGTTPLFGDDDGGRLAMLDIRAANDFRGTLGVGAAVFDRGDYKFVAGDAAEELLWLTGAEGLSKFDSLVATQPVETSKEFPEGGYFVMRDGWSTQANYMLFDCGPHGALNCGHAHADALSFDLAANGRTILVDPGTYTYTGSKSLRDWFRSSQAHNTVTIDDQSSSLPKDAFSWLSIAHCSLRKWISNNHFDFVSGGHDGYARLPEPATLTRSILFIKGNYWIVRDVVSSAKEHSVDVRFLLDPSTSGDLAGLDIKCFATGGTWTEEEISVSHCYGESEDSKSLKFSARLADGDIVTFLLPKNGIDWNVEEIEDQDGRAFQVSGANHQDLVIIRPAGWLWQRSVEGHVHQTISLKH